VKQHWNIQLNVQRVTEEQEKTGNALARGMAPVKKETLQVAEVKVQADTEVEAFAKVRRLLDATQNPASYGVVDMVPAEKLGDGKYRPIRDNPQA
jgi:hypothetical protein